VHPTEAGDLFHIELSRERIDSPILSRGRRLAI
jgi:hypothetical protein